MKERGSKAVSSIRLMHLSYLNVLQSSSAIMQRSWSSWCVAGVMNEAVPSETDSVIPFIACSRHWIPFNIYHHTHSYPHLGTTFPTRLAHTGVRMARPTTRCLYSIRHWNVSCRQAVKKSKQSLDTYTHQLQQRLLHKHYIHLSR